MAPVNAVKPVSALERAALYKDDHPRDIDRYIDFFGDGTRSHAAVDRCGDLLLEMLA
jgi:hypothetical protein